MQRAWLLALTLLVMPAMAYAQSEPIRQEPAAPTTSEEQPAPKPLATNRHSFLIPVTVDRASRDHVPVEVQLLVSADQGQTWSTYARQSADSKGFQFQGRDDGEYWFASRTIDAQGRPKPAGDVEPELRIVIDTQAPKIEIDAAIDASGQIKAAWRISDANLTPDAAHVEYQSGESLKPAWQNVPLDPALQKLAAEMLIGNAVWKPEATSRAVDVRITARDQAGNATVESRRVFLPRESRVPSPKIPEWPPRVSPTSPDNSSPSSSGDPFTSRQISPVKEAPAAERRGTTNSTPITPPSPQDKLAGSMPISPLAREPVTVTPPVTDRVIARPSSTGGNTSPLIWPSDTTRDTPSSSLPSTIKPTPLEPLSPPAGIPTQPRLPAEAPSPAGEQPQLTSSKSFSLDYDIDSVGPSGVRAVELWVTIDGGNTWEKWGEDADRQSPFEIQVESERTFGFRMVIVANNGLATRSPEPGDPADLTVAVDATKPRARLLQAGYGQGEHAGQLDVRWEADDEHLGARPVTISFGETPDGPFTTIAAGLPNNGQHFWTIDPRTPRQLYLRLEVRDEAGNVGSDQTVEPISLEGLSPKGRIRAITPAASGGPAMQGAFRTPLFR